ncbi:MAG: HXXEE domain-containing protein [Actinobacteria bacterium]|nr:HXXEE domain-containing protein [Actinomycetota bacterium]
MDPEDKESKIFWYLAAASGAHVVEEYLWPGGFLESAKEIAPEAFEHASLPIIFGVNASMILGCIYGALMRKRNPIHGLSMASLLFVNSLIHLGASIRMKKYVPGLVTGLVLYVPLSLHAFSAYKKSAEYKRSTAVRAAVQGLAYHSIPFVSFAIRGALIKGSGDSGEG